MAAHIKRKQIGGLLAWLILSLSAVFFDCHRDALAFADILLLWALVVSTLISCWRIRPLAGAVLVPCLPWVSVASTLNDGVWRLTPQVVGRASGRNDGKR